MVKYEFGVNNPFIGRSGQSSIKFLSLIVLHLTNFVQPSQRPMQNREASMFTLTLKIIYPKPKVFYQ